MNHFQEIAFEEFNGNPFTMLMKDGMLFTAKDHERVNAMAAAWGGFGVLWDKYVVYGFIRPQRYTRELVDASDSFSLTFFEKCYRDTVVYFGSVSGRDEDKIAKSGLTVAYDDDTPYFAEGNLVFICKKIYGDKVNPNAILDPAIKEMMYQKSDFHHVYVGEIVKILQKSN